MYNWSMDKTKLTRSIVVASLRGTQEWVCLIHKEKAQAFKRLGFFVMSGFLYCSSFLPHIFQKVEQQSQRIIIPSLSLFLRYTPFPKGFCRTMWCFHSYRSSR